MDGAVDRWTALGVASRLGYGGIVVRFLASSLLALALPGCVPTEFTYSEETDTQPPPGTCGNNVVEGDEECDEGPANADDFDDVGLASTTLGQQGCTTSCRHAVAWSRTNELDEQGAYFGVEIAEDGTIVAGGSHMAVTTAEVVDPLRQRFDARRVIDAFDAAGAASFSIVDRDPTPQSGVIAMGPMKSALLYVEVFEQSGVQKGTFLRGLRGQTELFQTERVTEEAFPLAVGPGAGDSALGLGWFQGSVHLYTLDIAGTLGEVDVDPGAALTGDVGPGAVVGGSDGAIVAWGSRVAMLSPSGALLHGLDLPLREITSVCRSSDQVVVAGRSHQGGGTSAVVLRLDASLQVTSETTVGGAASAASVNDVACDANGDAVAVGEEAISDAFVPSVRSRAFVAKVDPEGQVRWRRTHTSGIESGAGATDNDAYAVTIGADGSIYVAGREMTRTDTASAWLRKYGP